MAARLVVDFVGVLTVEVGVVLVRFVVALGVTSGRDANEALADKGFPSDCAVGIVKIVWDWGKEERAGLNEREGKDVNSVLFFKVVQARLPEKSWSSWETVPACVDEGQGGDDERGEDWPDEGMYDQELVGWCGGRSDETLSQEQRNGSDFLVSVVWQKRVLTVLTGRRQGSGEGRSGVPTEETSGEGGWSGSAGRQAPVKTTGVLWTMEGHRGLLADEICGGESKSIGLSGGRKVPG
jgi:hypothetical protein